MLGHIPCAGHDAEYRPYTRMLKKRAQFVRLNKQGKRFHRSAFALLLLKQVIFENQDFKSVSPVRVGFTATKKLGKAHRRIRAKRRMRALWRTTVIDCPTLFARLLGYDCVLIAKQAIFTQKFAPLQQDLLYSLDSLLKREHSGDKHKKRQIQRHIQ